MKSPFRLFSLILVVSLMTASLAQAAPPAAGPKPNVEAPSFSATYGHALSLHTLVQDFISPVTTDAKYALATGATLTTVAFVLRNQIDDPVNKYFVREKPLGTSGLGDQIGQMIPNLVYFGSMLAIYAIDSDPVALRRSDLMFRATLHSSLATLILKPIIQEGRPYNFNVKTSFPSGHSSSTFAFASAVAMEHEWYWGVGAYLLATYVAASRINDNQHHFRDVLAGTTIGISYGMGVWYRMELERNARHDGPDRRDRRDQVFLFNPTDDLRGAEFLYSASF